MDKATSFLPTISGVAALAGMVGGIISDLLGGWDAWIAVLIIAMGADYISGLVVAGVFKRSKKSENGALESRAGWKGLFRKGMTLLIVMIAAQLDQITGSLLIRDGVIIAYLVNELISLTENAGLMGVPILPPIKKAIAILKTKSGGENTDG